ncbi:hypothetical protein JCM19297_1797 [Nonlabens ulvanivorans]|nr:hypothetical protein JCM19297_1797 [Nonlabens ulvanivorans]
MPPFPRDHTTFSDHFLILKIRAISLSRKRNNNILRIHYENFVRTRTIAMLF